MLMCYIVLNTSKCVDNFILLLFICQLHITFAESVTNAYAQQSFEAKN